MTGIQASGVGSGLDISSLVSQLVTAERQPLDARISRRQSAVNVEISGLSTLKSALSTLKDSLSSVRTLSALASLTAKSADEDIFTATADSTALAGSYQIEVGNLATAQKLASGPFAAGRDAVVGTGTLTLKYGTTSFNVTIDSTHDTLAGIRDAINSATGNDGITATIINGTDGARLALSSRSTGLANAMTITQSGGDGGLAALVYDAANPGANTLTETSAAADATIYVNSYKYTSASNTVTGAVDGLTLNLLKADPGKTYALDVSSDASTVATRIKKFVTDYNALARVFSGLQAYDAVKKTSGPLLGNAYVRVLQQNVRSDLSNSVSGLNGNYTSLAAIGIKTDSTGQLVVDDTKLNAALKSDFNGVMKVFAADDGVANRLYTRFDAALKADAQLAQRNATLNKELTKLSNESADVDTQMAAVEKRYRAQFTALDSLLTQMQTTSSFLTRQFATKTTSN